jgi:hypothetical protein
MLHMLRSSGTVAAETHAAQPALLRERRAAAATADHHAHTPTCSASIVLQLIAKPQLAACMGCSTACIAACCHGVCCCCCCCCCKHRAATDCSLSAGCPAAVLACCQDKRPAAATAAAASALSAGGVHGCSTICSCPCLLPRSLLLPLLQRPQSHGAADRSLSVAAAAAAASIALLQLRQHQLAASKAVASPEGVAA